MPMLVGITNNEPQPLLLSEPVCDNPQFAATLRPYVPGQAYELEVRAGPPLIPARPGAPITPATSIPYDPVAVRNFQIKPL